jgi:hypothetical protein
MKMCFSLVYLLTLGTAFAQAAAAQAGLPNAQIVTLSLDPQDITVLRLRRGFVSSVRLPEEVSSVVLGDPGAFKAEHSEAEPQLVFFKPTTPKPAETNALITTRSGREISLTLVSEGNSDRGGTVDYVLKYERPRSFLIEAAHPSFVIGDTKSLTRESPPPGNAQGRASTSEQELLRQQRLETPHWVGKPLRVAVGPAAESNERMTVAFSVLNGSGRTIELLPPQIQLAGTAKKKQGKTIKAEPVAIKEYQMTARRLAPGARVDGVVTFERPAFKESHDRLLLQVAQAEEVDRPVLAPIAFVAAKRETK